MSTKSFDYRDLVSVAEAARRLHKRRPYITEFAKRHNLYVEDGTRIKVPLSLLEARMATPPKEDALDPLVRC